MVERYIERYSRNYELNDQQKDQVRARLEEIKTRQRAFSEEHWGEFQAMRQEFWQLRSSGGEPDPQKFGELRERFDALRRESPLFNDDRVAENVEQLLPPEQVEAGRARRQAESAEWEQRREERRQEWEQRRQQWESQRQSDGQSQDVQNPDQPAPMPPAWGGPDGERDEDREARRREWRERRERSDGDRGDRDRGDRDRDRSRGEQSRSAEGSAEAGQLSTIIRENPVGPWEQYVRDFTQKFNLDTAQQATAESVLREVMKRRTSYEQTHRDDFDAARRVEGSSDREKRMGELNRPVVSMFEELKSRLMRIPSSAQRQAAGLVSVSTSRPAYATSRPSSTTRPAGERNREPANSGGNRSNR
jgi:hypothetical protein